MVDDASLAHLVHQTVERLSLDLRGLSVLTEAATGPFAATAALAAVAGADRVVAIARDSAFGDATTAASATQHVVRMCHVEGVVDVVRALQVTDVGACDVITNLGFVRPLDARVISWLKPTAVIALMCEAWEYRAGDIDLDACRKHDIVVLATDEHASAWPVFDYCGPLAIRLLQDAGVALRGTRVTVLGGDPFTPVIVDALAAGGARVRFHTGRRPDQMLDAVADAQVIVVAEYSGADTVIGDGGTISALDVARVAPHAMVVQFAGAVHADSLKRHGLSIWPQPTVGPHRMSRTLAHLGPRPVVELHAAGLQVGALAARARRAGLTPAAAIAEVCQQSTLAQALPSYLEAIPA